MTQFDLNDYWSLSSEAREQLKIQCAQNTWSASVYTEAGFTTVKNIYVDRQYNLGVTAQFWP